jgi:hypothetical protein
MPAGRDSGTAGMNAIGVVVVMLAVLGGAVLIVGLLVVDYQNERDHRRWQARQQRWAARQQRSHHG